MHRDYQPGRPRSIAKRGKASITADQIRESDMATKLYAQGDIILELVEDATPVVLLPGDPDGAVVLGRGELTGHRHAFYACCVALLRDDALARDIPEGLYIGHVKVNAPSADLRHEEHATISLPAGTYRVRRQQEWTGREPQLLWE